MAMASRSEDIVERIGADFLTCAVCRDTYDCPKILPCHHSFCQKCLQSIVDTSSDLNLRCPTCREPWRVPPGGVSQLDDNFYINSLKEQLQVHMQHGRTEGKCEFCLLKPVSHICIDCNLQRCCNDCSKTHTRAMVSRSHQVLTINEYNKMLSTDSSSVRPVKFCKTHETTRIEIFCETCKRAVCQVCALVDHKGHRFKNLKAVIDVYIQELSQMADSLEIHSSETKRKRGEGRQKTVLSQRERMREKSKVHRRAEEVHQMVSKEEQRLVNEIDQDFDMKNRQNEKALDEVELEYGRLVSMNSYIKRLIQSGNAVDLLQNRNTLAQQVEELLRKDTTPKLHRKMVEFSPTTDLEARRLLGVIRSGDVCLSKCTVGNIPENLMGGTSAELVITTRDSNGKAINTKQAVTVTVQKPGIGFEVEAAVADNRDGTWTASIYGDIPGNYQVTVKIGDQEIPGSPFEFGVLIPLLKTYGEIGSEWGQFNNPSSVAINRHGQIVVTDQKNRRIQILGLDGKVIKVFSFRQFQKKFKPRDVAVSSDGDLFMTDYWNHQVVVSDGDGEFIRCFGQNELKYPRGIAISPVNSDVYVTEWDGKAADTDKDVRRYRQDGKYHSSFGEYGTDHGQFKGPYFIAITKDGKVIISDFHNHRIQVFGTSNHFLYAFGSFGQNNGQFYGPTGVSVSRDNKIYVADKLNRIQKFDITGEFIGRIDSGHDNLKHPRGITLKKETPTKVVVVDAGNDCIKVFVDIHGT